MRAQSKAYIQLHVAVVLYGFTAILGDLISLSALSLVWWRVLLTTLSMLFFVRFGRSVLRLPPKVILQFMGIGVIVAIHWLTFYGAIKYSNASITLAAFAVTSFFTSLIEPLLTEKRFDKLELMLGILVIPAMLLIATNIDLSLVKGLWIGLFSALLASFFSILNKKMVDKADSYQITFLEMGSAFLLLSFLLPFFIDSDTPLMPLPTDWVYLLILSLLCTTFAFIISLKALEHVSAFDANLVINLEPVYGIALAAVILKDHKEVSLPFYGGVAMILTIVLGYTWYKNRRAAS